MKINKYMLFLGIILLIGTISAGNSTKFIDTSGDEVVSINSSGSIGGVGNITFLDSTNGYGFFRNLGNSITNIIEGWFENMFISGNATINGSIWGRDYPQSTLLSCNFDQSLTCDGGENPNFTSAGLGATFLDSKVGDFEQGYNASTGNSLSYQTPMNIDKDKGTLSMWINPTWDGDDGVEHRFFDMETSSNTNGLTVHKTTANALTFIIRDSDGILRRGSSYAVDGNNFAKDTWHNIIVVWDGVTGNLKAYLDGVDITQDSGTGTGTILISPSVMYIGRDATSQTAEALGVIDELQIFNRALNAKEIKQLYEVGLINKSVTGHTANRENIIFSAYANTNSGTFTSSTEVIQFDTEIRKGELYSSPTDENVTIDMTGDYLVNFDCSIDVDTGSSRSTARCFLVLDGLSEIDGTKCFTYNRVAGNGDETCSMTRIVSLTEGDIISVGMIRHTGGDTLIGTADGSRINLEYKP